MIIVSRFPFLKNLYTFALLFMYNVHSMAQGSKLTLVFQATGTPSLISPRERLLIVSILIDDTSALSKKSHSAQVIRMQRSKSKTIQHLRITVSTLISALISALAPTMHTINSFQPGQMLPMKMTLPTLLNMPLVFEISVLMVRLLNACIRGKNTIHVMKSVWSVSRMGLGSSASVNCMSATAAAVTKPQLIAARVQKLMGLDGVTAFGS